MGFGNVVDKILGRESSIDFKLLVCRECDWIFESAKYPEQAACPYCRSDDVAVINTTDSHT